METSSPPVKPLGRKAYGSIPHLPNSRMGPGDHKCHEGQARIATIKTRDRHDTVLVQEKLDGTCVAVAKIGTEIVPLIRAGYRADSSHYRQHHLFAQWVYENQDRFDRLLNDGDRAVGEWLAQAHGTRYDLTGREPFVLFDIMRDDRRATWEEVVSRSMGEFVLPYTFSGPTSVAEAMQTLGEFGRYGALDPIEGAVWRVEREGRVDFLVKYVRPDKVDGSYLDSVTGEEPVWNWPSHTRSLTFFEAAF